MTTIKQCTNNFVINVLSRTGVIGDGFPIDPDRWNRMLENKVAPTFGEIRAIAEYCHCSMAELVQAQKQFKVICPVDDVRISEEMHNRHMDWMIGKLRGVTA